MKPSASSMIVAVATLLTFLAALAGVVWSFFIPHLGMGLSCAGLAVLFGFFVRNDYYKLFQAK